MRYAYALILREQLHSDHVEEEGGGGGGQFCYKPNNQRKGKMVHEAQAGQDIHIARSVSVRVM